MTKLEAWKAWSATAGTDGTEFTLEKSSHGKAFNYAWGAALAAEREACADILDRNADRCDEEGVLYKVLSANAAAIRARGGSNDQT